MTDLAVRTSLCPAWCVATHYDNQDVHHSPIVWVEGSEGPAVSVHAVYDSTSDRHTVFVGDTEFGQDGACELLSAIRQAMDLPLRAAVAR